MSAAARWAFCWATTLALAWPSRLHAEQPIATPALQPARVTVRVPARVGFPALEALAAQARTTVVLDLHSDLQDGALKRGRVELLRAAHIAPGIRLHHEPNAALVRLLRRLGPLPLLEVVPTATLPKDLASMASSLRGVSAGRRRVVLAVPPSAAQLAALTTLRDVAVRFPWPVEERAREAVFASFERFPGHAEVALPEGISQVALAAVKPPPRVLWVLAPDASCYVADATLAALAVLRGTGHVIETAHAVRPVDVAQLVRLPGLAFELVREGTVEDGPALHGLHAMLRHAGR